MEMSELASFPSEPSDIDNENIINNSFCASSSKVIKTLTWI